MNKANTQSSDCCCAAATSHASMIAQMDTAIILAVSLCVLRLLPLVVLRIMQQFG